MSPTQLSILTAVLDGHTDSVRSTIETIPSRGASPFASVPGTHNGRFAVVTPKALAPRTLLMCSATIDEPVPAWLNGFLSVLGPTADAIWSHCAGWPGVEDARSYLLAHRVQPALSFATWDASVPTIVDALATHRRLRRLAVRAQGLAPDALLDAYRAELAR